MSPFLPAFIRYPRGAGRGVAIKEEPDLREAFGLDPASIFQQVSKRLETLAVSEDLPVT